MIERILERRASPLFFICALIAVFIYQIVGGIYRPQNVDDSWTLSALYEFHRHGVTQDTVFGATLASEGQDGVHHFAKLQATIYGLILDTLGWTRSASHMVSTLFIGLGALIWGVITWKLTGRRSLAVAAVILLLLSEPLFGPAHQSRPEALTFFLASAALALYIYQRTFLAGLFVGLAFEVHPVGLYAGIYIAAAFFARARATSLNAQLFSRSTVLMILGFLLGLIIYLLLHIDALSTLMLTLSQSNTGSQNYLLSYFFKAKYMRHIPELVFFVAMLVLYIRGEHWRDAPTLAWLFAFVCLSLFVIQRGNMHYVLYVYTPILVLALWTAAKKNKLHTTFLACFAFFVAQYGAVYYLNHRYSFEAYLEVVSRQLPNDDLAVVGTSNDWFHNQEREFYAFTYGPEAFTAVAPRAFYLIRNESPYMSLSWDRFYENIDRMFNCSPISTMAVGGEDVQIDRCERQNNDKTSLGTEP